MSGVMITEGLTMLDGFLSVGVSHFSLTRTNLRREPRDYRPGRNEGAMRLLLPELIPRCWEHQENLIVRPEAPSAGVLVQLDDLGERQLGCVGPSAFMTVVTSPGSFQAWLAVKDGDAKVARRLMERVGADTRATCSGRVAGSPNCKPQYAPNFPMVQIVTLQPSHWTEGSELEASGLLTPEKAMVVREWLRSSWNRGWPDYARCLRGAPVKADGSPDRSRADFLWCKWALERGNSFEDVAMMLVRVSEKARQESEKGNGAYAERTVKAAMGGLA